MAQLAAHGLAKARVAGSNPVCRSNNKGYNMIPKIIHYSWISGDEYPPQIQACIDTWGDKLKGYQFINWNRDTFDFSSSRFLTEAYADKNYAFCSDFLRIYALYNYGGIWLDTDVHVIKPYDDFLHLPYFFCHEPFFGYLNFSDIVIEAATMGAEKGHPIFSCALQWYNTHFYNSIIDNIPEFTCPKVLRGCINYLYEMKNYHYLINIDDFNTDETHINVFSNIFFSPRIYDYNKNLLIDNTQEKTYSVHCFNGAWVTENFKQQFLQKCK